MFYFNAFPRDGIFEIDMHNRISNDLSIYTCSNKKSKHNLDSTFPWHCHLGHINKKHIEKLQHDGILKSIDDESFDVCVSGISGKMERKPFTYASERADDLLGIIHSDEHELGDHREPPNYRVALSDLESKKCLEAMNVEMQSMKDNQVWNSVDLPPNCKTDRRKWLFKKKTNMDGNIHAYKARLVAKGFTLTYGVDYEEIVSPVTDIKAIRSLIDISAYFDYEIWKMDVKTAFLNDRLNEDVYMVQLEGFVNPKHPGRVCKLQRSIYVLKQASRSWNKRFNKEIKKYGFTQNPDEPCVYKKAIRSIIVFLILYVDDILLMGNNIPMLQDVKSWLGSFAIKDLGIPYASTVDSIMYVVRCTRPDVAFSQMLTSRYQQNPGESHWTAVKNILKYLRNTKDMFLVYGGDSITKLAEYIATMEAIWLRKFIYGLSVVPSIDKPMDMYCDNTGAITIADEPGVQKGAKHFQRKYHFIREAIQEAIWIRKFISGLGVVPSIDKPMDMYCDNTGAITIADEPGVQKGAKHFQRKYHFIREAIQEGDIRILKVHTNNNLVDLFTNQCLVPNMLSMLGALDLDQLVVSCRSVYFSI
nr:retrovirus-related Pol polyprotein from transposon TNT 1-94 [Tanacetum cinerariifolium]